MKPPIIINSRGDVYFYSSLEDAQIDLEPIDVNNNEYVIYDSNGLLLAAVVEENLTYDPVKIYSTTEMRKEELIDVLVGYLSNVGHDVLILETLNLDELIQIGSDLFRK